MLPMKKKAAPAEDTTAVMALMDEPAESDPALEQEGSSEERDPAAIVAELQERVAELAAALG